MIIKALHLKCDVYSTSTITSISTAIFRGKEPIPTADIACSPRSPKPATIDSDKPAMRSGSH